MSRIFIAACFLAISCAAPAETYDECLKRVLDAQVKCEVPCSKSEEACSKCNEGVRRMQKRCEEQTRNGAAGKRES
jgi:hypothetical protein